MGKYLSKYQSEADYNNNKDTHLTPHISLILKPIKRMSYIKKQVSYIDEYFTIKALEDGLTAKLSGNECEYRINNGSWNTLSSGSNTPSINKGQTLSFRGNLTPESGIGTFTISKKCSVYGNIMSLLFGDDFEGKTDLTGYNLAFCELFFECITLIDASNLILPATTLASCCYDSMFCDCTGLTSAPELPATTLAEDCYYGMFKGCTCLTSAPELPATTLVEYCYGSMFEGCTSLTTAPQLPATTLADYCYYEMFYGCTSLIVAPELPATTLADYCYGAMFQGCTSLTESPSLPATTLANNCYKNMFSGTNVLPDCSNIDFSNEEVVTSCGLNGLFAGTKVTDADLERILPKNSEGKYCLPATTLAHNCYVHMFRDCTSLTSAPELPATTLANNCYGSMFKGCSSLVTAPALPATTLAIYCYQYMFSGCTSLTSAPELPATTLTNYCYYEMFYGCTKLNHITILATNISANKCLYNWVYSVASNGLFIKHPDMTSLPSGVSGIPSGWIVKNYGQSNLITFTFNEFEYQAEEGMTWEEWVNSEYNTINAYIDSNNTIFSPGIGNIVLKGYYIYKTDVIIKDGEYIYLSGGLSGGADD